MSLKPVSIPRLFPVGPLARPDPCLDLELQERFLGRRVPTRFWQCPRDKGFGDDDAVLLGLASDRPPLDARFLDDVRTVVHNWLAHWSSFRLSEIRAAFQVDASESDALFEVRPVQNNVDVPFILASLRRNGASLKPTLH